MLIATWNVNSLKARLPHVLAWLDAYRPDALCLQETKCQDAEFPALEISGAGYRAAILGQKSYNGVAILTRVPPDAVRLGLPGDPADVQARYLEVDLGPVTVASIYLPNGNPVETEKYPYKLGWMDRLRSRAEALLATERVFVLAGDYNICPTDDDVYDPVGWRHDALCRPESRARFRAFQHLGLTDAFRALDQTPHRYSFWDYQAGRWPRDEGLRIDHLMLSPQAADRLEACEIDRAPRGAERASDHTPVWCRLGHVGTPVPSAA